MKSRRQKSETTSINEYFRKFAQRSSAVLGSPWAFAGAITVIAIWALIGPRFNYSDTWQLVINTSTTIITFLMVFLIQNSQNRDAKALHLKLDELLLAMNHRGSRDIRKLGFVPKFDKTLWIVNNNQLGSKSI